MPTLIEYCQARMKRRTILCVALLLFNSRALTAQNANHPVRNVVLVHGAWADGSGWKGVYDILTKDGYRVSIVQEPETSFKDDVANHLFVANTSGVRNGRALLQVQVNSAELKTRQLIIERTTC